MSTKVEDQWMSDAAALGCVVCRNLGYGESPAEIHHLRADAGMSQRAKHNKTIPLCAPHHRTGGYGVAFHAGERIWQENFGNEQSLYEQTVIDVDVFRSSIYGRAV